MKVFFGPVFLPLGLNSLGVVSLFQQCYLQADLTLIIVWRGMPGYYNTDEIHEPDPKRPGSVLKSGHYQIPGFQPQAEIISSSCSSSRSPARDSATHAVRMSSSCLDRSLNSTAIPGSITELRMFF